MTVAHEIDDLTEVALEHSEQVLGVDDGERGAGVVVGALLGRVAERQEVAVRPEEGPIDEVVAGGRLGAVRAGEPAVAHERRDGGCNGEGSLHQGCQKFFLSL